MYTIPVLQEMAIYKIFFSIAARDLIIIYNESVSKNFNIKLIIVRSQITFIRVIRLSNL